MMLGRGLGAVDCSQPVLRSNYYGQECNLGQGASTQQCLDQQDALEQQFVSDQQAYWAACDPGNLPAAQAQDAATAMATYGASVYGSAAPAAAAQSASWQAALNPAPVVSSAAPSNPASPSPSNPTAPSPSVLPTPSLSVVPVSIAGDLFTGSFVVGGISVPYLTAGLAGIALLMFIGKR